MERSSWTDRIDVTGNQLVERVKQIAQDANARQVRILDQDGKELLVVPLGWGAAGGAMTLFVAPWLIALAGIGAVVAKLRIEVERVSPDGDPGAATTDTAAGFTPAAGTTPENRGEDLGESGADGMPIIHTDTAGWDAPPSDDTGPGTS